MKARINSKYYFRIYKLLHPITNDVFYVGISQNSLPSHSHKQSHSMSSLIAGFIGAVIIALYDHYTTKQP
jgi:hypothetical protein